jgi:hypothetical protein
MRLLFYHGYEDVTRSKWNDEYKNSYVDPYKRNPSEYE